METSTLNRSANLLAGASPPTTTTPMSSPPPIQTAICFGPKNHPKPELFCPKIWRGPGAGANGELANPAYMAPGTWAYKCENENETAIPEEQTNDAIQGYTNPGKMINVSCPPPMGYAVLASNPKVWRTQASPPEKVKLGKNACGTYPKWRPAENDPGVPCTTVKPPKT
jgi:hypothetical protein